jgi:hypothetical protein
MATLNDLFAFADIDDVTEEDYDGRVELVFTTREPRQNHTVYGSNLDEAVEEARKIVLRELTLYDLRREGLSDEDIDRLANESLAGEQWARGYEAGVADVAKASINQMPTTAAAGEPFGVIDSAAVLSRHPMMSVIYAPVAIIQLGNENKG